MKAKTHLLIIDPQNDFCDLPTQYLPMDPITGERLGPTLAVPGAHADMLRLATLIQRGIAQIDNITGTLDTHHRIGIERPTFWMYANGEPVMPYTEITAHDVRIGRIVPRLNCVPKVLAYLDALEALGRYKLMVWPIHCETGTWGHNIHHDIRLACNLWEEQHTRTVNWVAKGANPWTEHYSALQAEVPDEQDPETMLNQALVDSLNAADTILIAGEAGSHCVKATVEHLADNLGQAHVAKLVLLTDCISPVAGYEKPYQDFLQTMQNKGLTLATSFDYFN